MKEESLLQKAHCCINEGNYEKAIEYYNIFANKYKELSTLVEANKKYCLKRLNSQEENSSNFLLKLNLSDIFYRNFGIEQIYVTSLEKQYLRRAMFLREMNKYNIKVKICYGEDGRNSEISKLLLKKYKDRSHGNFYSTMHIDKLTKIKWKKELNTEVFAYLISQKKIIEDSIKNNYKRILVFDDDVFFHSNALNMLKILSVKLPKEFKIIALGASEYTDTNIKEFSLYKIKYLENIAYHPIPGNTCGSFAMIYDKSVFYEIIKYIEEFDGPYDNATLGKIYLNYKNDCYIVNPAICIPNVNESNIRKCRNQKDQSLRMNWEFKRYNEFIKAFNIGIIVKSSIDENTISNLTTENTKAKVDIYLLYENLLKKINSTKENLEINFQYKNNIENICEKIIKHYDVVIFFYNNDLSIENIHKILCDAFVNVNQKNNKVMKNKNYYCLINNTNIDENKIH